MIDPWLPGEVSGREAALQEQLDEALARAERAEALLERTEEEVCIDLRAQLARFASLDEALLVLKRHQDTCCLRPGHLDVGRVILSATTRYQGSQPTGEMRAQAQDLLAAIAALFESAGGDRG